MQNNPELAEADGHAIKDKFVRLGAGLIMGTEEKRQPRSVRWEFRKCAMRANRRKSRGMVITREMVSVKIKRLGVMVGFSLGVWFADNFEEPRAKIKFPIWF